MVGTLRPSHAVDLGEVDVGVIVGVDATGRSRCGLGTSRSSCLPSVGRVHVYDHVHVHDHLHDPAPTCPRQAP